MAQIDTIVSNVDSPGLTCKPKVLVTGATGFLGGRLTQQLIGQGFPVRAFARKASNTAKLQSIGADICVGDINDVASLMNATDGMDVVVHAAADTTGDASAGRLATISGTQNTIKAASMAGIKQIIYISSCGVYGTSQCQPGQQIDETGPLESQPEARGNYAYAKFRAEQIVLAALKNKAMKVTCLRPGTIWGPGGEIFTPIIGFRVSSRLFGIIGNGKFVLPLVYLDNLVSAIITCIDHPSSFNQIFNVVDTPPVDKQTFTNEVLKSLFPKAFFIRIPYWILHIAVGCQEWLFKFIGRNPFLTRYRLISSQNPIVYDSSKIMNDLDWTAPVNFHSAVRYVLRSDENS